MALFSLTEHRLPKQDIQLSFESRLPRLIWGSRQRRILKTLSIPITALTFLQNEIQRIKSCLLAYKEHN